MSTGTTGSVSAAITRDEGFPSLVIFSTWVSKGESELEEIVLPGVDL